MLAALSPQRRRVVLGAGGLVVLFVVVLIAVTVVRAAVSGADPVPQDQPGPVLLVPGYGGGLDSLVPLERALRAGGRMVLVVEPVGDGTGDLNVQAQHLDEVARRLRDTAGSASVDVVGYSAGGVVARLWVRDHGGDDVARRVLTLGSPQHGTSQAALGAELAGGCSAACEQLVPDSDLLRRLNSGDETPDGPLWATVRSTSDLVVTPTDSAELDGAVNVLVQQVCPGATTDHGSLPGDPVVLATLRSVLGVAAPVVPTDVSC